MIEQPDSRPWGDGYRTFAPYSAEIIHGARLRITIPAGFVYDGASVPRLLWSLTSLTPDGPIRAAALVHDYLYQHGGRVPVGQLEVFLPHRAGGGEWIVSALAVTRAQADYWFYKLMLAAGISEPLSRTAWAGVRLGGWTGWGG